MPKGDKKEVEQDKDLDSAKTYNDAFDKGVTEDLYDETSDNPLEEMDAAEEEDEKKLEEKPEIEEDSGGDPLPDDSEKEPEKSEKPDDEIFSFDDETPSKEEQEEVYETIVWNGQDVQVKTREEAKNLMQKGFDYDKKVGPHGKFAQMLSSDPVLEQVLSDTAQKYWENKRKMLDPNKDFIPAAQQQHVPMEESEKLEEPEKPAFSIKPLAEYESEMEWLQDNVSNIIKAQNAEPKQTAPTDSQQPAQPQPLPQGSNQVGDKLLDMIITRDPINYQLVLDKMYSKYLPQMKVSDVRRINEDLPSLFKLYDWVKSKEVRESSEEAKQDASMNFSNQNSSNAPSKPSFRIKSGGGQPDRDDKKNDPEIPWKIKKDDFETLMQKVKGFQ